MTRAFQLGKHSTLRARHITEPVILTVSQLEHSRKDPMSPAGHETANGHPVPPYSRTVHIRPRYPNRLAEIEEMFHRARVYPPRSEVPELELPDNEPQEFKVTNWPKIPNWTDGVFCKGSSQIEVTLKVAPNGAFYWTGTLRTPPESKAPQAFQHLGGRLDAQQHREMPMDEHDVNDLLGTWRNPLDHLEGETLGLDSQSGQVARWSRYSDTTMNGHVVAYLETPNRHIDDLVMLTAIRSILAGYPTLIIDGDERYRKLIDAMGGITAAPPSLKAGIWPSGGHTYDIDNFDLDMIAMNRQAALSNAAGRAMQDHQQIVNLVKGKHQQVAVQELAGSQWLPMFQDDTVLRRMQEPLLTRATICHLPDDDQAKATALLTSAAWEAALTSRFKRLLIIDPMPAMTGEPYTPDGTTTAAEMLLTVVKRARKHALAVMTVLRDGVNDSKARLSIIQNSGTKLQPSPDGAHVRVNAGSASSDIIMTATREEWELLKECR